MTHQTTQYRSIVLMGKIASGKGTQAQRVHETFGGVLYSTGNKVREAAEAATAFGSHMKEVYEAGLLIPEWIASYWMTDALVAEYPETTVIFEGVAKKPDEAKLFHEIHTWLGRPYIVFNLEIPDDTVRVRSADRQRDLVDGAPIVERRLSEYATHTTQSIEYFSRVGNLVTIDGTQPIDEVTTAIFTHLNS